MSCSFPPFTQNAFMKWFEANQTVYYICRKGYTMIGSSFIFCEENGNWNNFPPLCEKSDDFFKFLLSISIPSLFIFFIAALFTYYIILKPKKMSEGLQVFAMKLKRNAPKGKLIIIFTDIESSSEIWSWNSKIMFDVIKMHDKILRKLIKKYKGYEVKTEGDSFMVVFKSIKKAILWSFAVQNQLLIANYPEKFFEQPNASIKVNSKGKIIQRGLRVRIAVHFGPVLTKTDSETKKIDYFGPNVNFASRIQGKTKGGQIVISESVLNELGGENAFYDLNFEDDFLKCGEINFLGEFTLKGIENKAKLYSICSEYFVDRFY